LLCVCGGEWQRQRRQDGEQSTDHDNAGGGQYLDSPYGRGLEGREDLARARPLADSCGAPVNSEVRDINLSGRTECRHQSCLAACSCP
jgi:hypothetical protein